MLSELGGELMRRMMMMNYEKSEFVKPEGTVTLEITENGFTDKYPVLDGVKVGVWNVSFYSNWLKLNIYDSEGELIETRNWQGLTTLTQDNGCYFEATLNNNTGTQVIHATWL